jgi:isoleucyl-tRNA synthetase
MAEEIKQKPVQPVGKSPVSQKEEEILAFWQKNNIFKKTVEKPAPKGGFVFYDGPPFATGLPHFGHLLPTSIKDAIPRYKTMQGFRVARKWGWDCHGLPVENLIEKELGLKTKQDIEKFGIGNFNKAAQDSVLRYATEWKKIIPRMGRFVDMEDDYRTMDASYTESVWWVFKTLHEKGLVHQGFKSMQLCPRCETTLSNFEVNQGYKDITDISVFVTFPLVDQPDAALIAWTTTPWTLPGNVALAVGADIVYVQIVLEGKKYIVAKERVAQVVKDKTYTVEKEFTGKDFVGKKYVPIFDYYAKDTALANRENGWKIVVGDFVTTTDGSGIVHIAPAFGEDDYELSKREKLPFVQHVTTGGLFKKEVADFAGQSVKPKEDHQKADIEIIKNLAHSGRLFGKEKIIHSYPHCWRCETPLLNYASSSWFVNVPKIKDRLVAENKKIGWTPEFVGEGRFGNWLSGAREWAISRSRYWGAPLPVWDCSECNKKEFIGSVEELKKHLKSRNTYYVMRHGQYPGNAEGFLCSDLECPGLNDTGRDETNQTAKNLSEAKIDIIITSPLARTKETALLVAEKLAITKENVIEDTRLQEIQFGVFNRKPSQEYQKEFEGEGDIWFTNAPADAESHMMVKRRMGDVIYDFEQKYHGKKVLIVTHDTPAWLLIAAAGGLNQKETISFHPSGYFMKNAEVREMSFVPFPHNADYELDLHRPYIDEVTFPCSCGGVMKRVPEVFDCWFESGAMPYGQAHHPFENTETFNPKSSFFKKSKGYPADFIAEGLDQTRGWFYSMLVLGVALFDKTPYKNVIVNGLILAEDGRKMSKRLQNYPDLMLTIDKYGADALRYYLLASPSVRAEDFCFSEKGVDEVVKKHIGRLNNVYTFFELYAGGKDAVPANADSKNVLDVWILAKLAELVNTVESSLEKYELDRAVRPVADFIDDLSTWYIRRSRDRFKSEDEVDKKLALATTRYVLLQFSKVIAPFMPFLAEDMYQKVKDVGGKESVHLESWPSIKLSTNDHQPSTVLEEMQEVRKIVSLGLEARMQAKINVRQPLSRLSAKSYQLSTRKELLALISDEVNVKEVVCDENLDTEVALDTTITPTLKAEGQVRELIRAIQDLRKKQGLTVADRPTLSVVTDDVGKKLLEEFKKDIVRIAQLKDLLFVDTVAGEKVVFGAISFELILNL